MKLPAYGRALWQQRLIGRHPTMIALLVGDRWTLPKWLPVDVPRLAVKTASWHEPTTERFDWRIVVDATLLAIDVRGPDEREETTDGWDPWLWLLAQAQFYAIDVIMFTPMIDFGDWASRHLEIYAWLNRNWNGERWCWPSWWPYDELVLERQRQRLAA